MKDIEKRVIASSIKKKGVRIHRQLVAKLPRPLDDREPELPTYSYLGRCVSLAFQLDPLYGATAIGWARFLRLEELVLLPNSWRVLNRHLDPVHRQFKLLQGCHKVRGLMAGLPTVADLLFTLSIPSRSIAEIATQYVFQRILWEVCLFAASRREFDSFLQCLSEAHPNLVRELVHSARIGAVNLVDEVADRSPQQEMAIEANAISLARTFVDQKEDLLATFQTVLDRADPDAQRKVFLVGMDLGMSRLPQVLGCKLHASWFGPDNPAVRSYRIGEVRLWVRVGGRQVGFSSPARKSLWNQVSDFQGDVHKNQLHHLSYLFREQVEANHIYPTAKDAVWIFFDKCRVLRFISWHFEPLSEQKYEVSNLRLASAEDHGFVEFYSVVRSSRDPCLLLVRSAHNQLRIRLSRFHGQQLTLEEPSQLNGFEVPYFSKTDIYSFETGGNKIILTLVVGSQNQAAPTTTISTTVVGIDIVSRSIDPVFNRIVQTDQRDAALSVRCFGHQVTHYVCYQLRPGYLELTRLRGSEVTLLRCRVPHAILQLNEIMPWTGFSPEYLWVTESDDGIRNGKLYKLTLSL